MRMRDCGNSYLVAALLAGAALFGSSQRAAAREWTDATGKFKMEADLIAFNDTHAVLERADKTLAIVAISELSAADQKYIASEEGEKDAAETDGMRDWTLAGGVTMRGRVVGYGQRELVFVRRQRKLWVNDRDFTSLPEFYQRMLPQIVGHELNMNIQTPENLLAWSVGQRRPRRFTVSGVMLELPSGDRYGIPFYFFSEADLAVLKPGWEKWLAAKQDSEERQQQDLAVESQSRVHDEGEQTAQVQQLQLAL